MLINHLPALSSAWLCGRRVLGDATSKRGAEEVEQRRVSILLCTLCCMLPLFQGFLGLWEGFWGLHMAPATRAEGDPDLQGCTWVDRAQNTAGLLQILQGSSHQHALSLSLGC